MFTRWKQEYLERASDVFKKGTSDTEKELVKKEAHIADLERNRELVRIPSFESSLKYYSLHPLPLMPYYHYALMLKFLILHKYYLTPYSLSIAPLVINQTLPLIL